MSEPRIVSAWSPSAGGLQEGPAGFWAAGSSGELSYPDDAHEACYQVEATSFWFAHRNRCVAATVRRLPPAGLFADVGGGNGFVSAALLDAGIELLLVEPGKEGAMNAWRRGVRPVVCARLEQAGVAAGSLGGIGLFDVVEHIEDDVAFLQEMRRHLAPDGRVYISVPAFQQLWSYEDDRAGHFRRYSARTLRAALRRAGFEVEYLSAMFVWLPLPVFFLRRVPSLLGRRTPGADRMHAEHGLPGGIGGRALSRLLDSEYKVIQSGGAFPIGGSLLAVARNVRP